MAEAEKQSMLSTIDNPYDPFTQWDQWLQFDTAEEYYTPALLARIALSSDELSETDQDEAIDTAIDEIIAEDALNLYIRVFEK